jgi:hypothetical protein
VLDLDTEPACIDVLGDDIVHTINARSLEGDAPYAARVIEEIYDVAGADDGFVPVGIVEAGRGGTRHIDTIPSHLSGARL